MDCKLCRENIYRYLRGQLSRSVHDVFEMHLAKCPDCNREVAQEKRLSEFLNEWPAPEPSLGFETRLAQRLQEARQPETGWWQRLGRGFMARPVWAGAAAVLMVGALAAVWVYNSQVLPEKQADMMVAQDMELFQDMEVIEYLDLLENWDEINALENDSEEQS